MQATIPDLSTPRGQTFGPSTGAAYDRLTPLQRRAMVGAIGVAHLAALWALLQVREVRDAVADVAPIFVSLVAPEPPPKVVLPPPPPAPPVRRHITPERAVVAAAPTPAPAPFVVAPPPEPMPPEPAPVAVAPPVAAPPAPPPPAPAAPRNLPTSSVEYLEPLQVEYPRLSKRLGETGIVMLRIFIDEAGRVRDAQVGRTSGHPRLDDAAMAAVQKARFKPPTVNGQAVSGYAQVPVDFQLER